MMHVRCGRSWRRVRSLALTAASARAEGEDDERRGANSRRRCTAALRATAGNLFYSPASIRIAMAMAAAGARGETATEMHHALALPPGDAAHAAIGKQLADWAALATPGVASTPATDPQMEKWQQQELEQKRVVLRVVNRLWAQAGHEFRDGVFEAAARRLSRTARHRRLSARRRARRHQQMGGGGDRAEDQIAHRQSDPERHEARHHQCRLFQGALGGRVHGVADKEEPFFVAGGKQVKVPLMRRDRVRAAGAHRRRDDGGAAVRRRAAGDGRRAAERDATGVGLRRIERRTQRARSTSG